MAITSIQTVSNNSPRSITFINTEYSGNNREIASNQTVGVGNCWIPWCTSAKDFPMHHVQLQDDSNDKVLWYVWQSGNSVHASTQGFDANAKTISAVGKSLAVTLLSDGSLTTNDFNS